MIISKDNQYIKLIRELSKRKYREEYGLFLAEGKRLIADLADAGLIPYLLLYAEDFEDKAFLERYAGFADQVFAVAPKLFHQLSETKNEQGVIAAFPQLCPELNGFEMGERGLLLILDNVADPGNLGAIIRNSAAAGVAAILMEEGCVDLYNPKVVRATMGTVAKIPVFFGLPRDEIVAYLLKSKVKTYLADLGDDVTYDALPVDGRVAVVFGNEGNGVSQSWRALGLPKVTIPMENGVESLNVAMAAGIIAFDHRRRSIKS